MARQKSLGHPDFTSAPESLVEEWGTCSNFATFSATDSANE